MPVDQNLMDWNDSIESDGQEFILLEEGNYNYVVTNFERGRFPGGQKKHGEKLVMNWNKVIGSVGRAHFKQRKYTNQAGEEKVINDLDKFIDYDPKYFTVDIDDKDLPF